MDMSLAPLRADAFGRKTAPTCACRAANLRS